MASHQDTSRSASRNITLDGLAEESSRLVEDASELGRRAAQTAGHAVQGLRNEGQAVLQAGRRKAGELKGNFDDMVSENPAKSVLIAAGVGAVIGFTLARMRR